MVYTNVQPEAVNSQFTKGEGTMEELKIYLEDSGRVKDLEARVAGLEGENASLIAEVRRLEFKFRCESIVNAELVDLCRAEGVDIRPALKRRPWEEEGTIAEGDKCRPSMGREGPGVGAGPLMRGMGLSGR